MRALCLIVALAGASTAQAQLWDQSAVNPLVDSLVNQEFSDRAELGTYIVSDFTVPAGPGWHVATMTSWYETSSFNATGVTQGRLNLFPKSGALPAGGDDPLSGIVVDIVIASIGGGQHTVTATINQDLLPGDYWIGVSPLTDFAVNGQAFHLANSTNRLDDDAVRNPGGGRAFPFGTDWGTVATVFDVQNWTAAMRLDGSVIPAPGAGVALLAGLGMMSRRRRA